MDGLCPAVVVHHRHRGQGHHPAHPRHDLLAAARAFAQTEEFTDPDRRMVERSIAWLVRGPNRRLRYRGTERKRIWLAHRAAAIDVARLIKLGLTHTATGWTIA